jgi:RsiW-degrading membrane proteinase PrsW (M82 family)
MSVKVETEDKVLIPLHKPGFKEKLFFLTSGIIVSVPLTLFIAGFSDRLCILMPMFYATICSVAIFAPFVEEFAKAYPLFYRHGETERSIFILGLLAGAGFGATEFVLYVFTLGEPILSRIPGVIFHAASTSITGYGIAKKQPIPFYLIAVALHFSNNFFAVLNLFGYIAGPATVAAAIFLSWHLFGKTKERIVKWH